MIFKLPFVSVGKMKTEEGLLPGNLIIGKSLVVSTFPKNACQNVFAVPSKESPKKAKLLNEPAKNIPPDVSEMIEVVFPKFSSLLSATK